MAHYKAAEFQCTMQIWIPEYAPHFAISIVCVKPVDNNRFKFVHVWNVDDRILFCAYLYYTKAYLYSTSTLEAPVFHVRICKLLAQQ